MTCDLYQEEQKLREGGYTLLAGVDEVGRGCLAGPVFAAAVVLPAALRLPQLDDSKKLSAPLRERLDGQIRLQALAWQVAWVGVEEIDKINILHASLKAMRLAVEGLAQNPHLVLVDGRQKIGFFLPQKTYVGGDAQLASIAAASVVAKVARDRYMQEQEKFFPHFSFGRHKGYGTAQHLEELRVYGATSLHRRSFAPVKARLNP